MLWSDVHNKPMPALQLGWPRSTRPAAVPHAHSEGRRPLLGRLCDSGLWAHLGARRAGLSSLSARADAQAERPTVRDGHVAGRMQCLSASGGVL